MAYWMYCFPVGRLALKPPLVIALRIFRIYPAIPLRKLAAG